MKTPPRLGLLGMLTLAAALAHGATRIDLDQGWAFTSGRSLIHSGPTVPVPVIVDLPHTWNRVGANYDKLGEFWYTRTLDLPKLPAGAIAQLNFGGVFYK